MVRLIPLIMLFSCGSPEKDPDESTPGADADTDTDTDTDSDTDADTDTDDTDTDTDTSPLTPWTCAFPSPCEWDCTGDGLLIDQPGTHNVEFTAECALTLKAWGAGGGGGGSFNQSDRGGGGGGGASLVVGDGQLVWVIGGGGGGGGAGENANRGGGGGGGGYGEFVTEFAVGDQLTLHVGGGGHPGCDNASGDGGEPNGGAGSTCSGDDSVHGGGGGRVAGCGSAGNSTNGGGGGGTGGSVYGGGGGGDSGAGCDGLSVYGDDGGCYGPAGEGGGGGGGGAFGTVQTLGSRGIRGDNGADGGGGADGTAGGGAAQANGLTPGGGGRGSGGCSGGIGGDGKLELVVTAGGTGLCPPGKSEDCNGVCFRDDYLGDGICDANLDCAATGDDGGDCPQTGLLLPTWMQLQCPNIVSQSAFCLTSEYGGGADVSLVGLDDGAVCSLLNLPGVYGYDMTQVAWTPPYRTVVAHDGYTLTEYELQTGVSRPANNVNAYYVTSWNSGILVDELFGWTFYPSFDDAIAGNGSAVNANLGSASRLGTEGDILYGAWHSTDTTEVADLNTGAALPSVVFSNYDGWTHGLDVVDGSIWVTTSNELRSFDVVTGLAGPMFPFPGGNLYGLECYDP